MTVALSVERVVSDGLAQAALRHIQGLSPRPAILTPDHRQAIRRMVRGSFGVLCLSLLPVIADCDMPAEGDCDADDIITMELKLEPSCGLQLFRLMAEHALSQRALALGLTDDDQEGADRMMESFGEAVRKMLAAFNLTAGARIRPAWI